MKRKISLDKNIFLIHSFKFNFVFIIFFINIIFLININKSQNSNISVEKCYVSPDDSNLKIIHFIITRFLIEFWPFRGFPILIYRKEYILNGIRVMKKYLFPSLENQRCKNFIWILKIGNKANITYIKSLLNLNNSFNSNVIYEKDIKSYIRNNSKGFDVLITSRIDYDDRIYYDAVNDIRKAININKPMILYGYNRGVQYFESDNKYYEFYKNYKNDGVMSIFTSLITVLNKTNDFYNIFELGTHIRVRKKILENFRLFGIKELNYEPAIIDNGEAKFVWVRQNYSGLYHYSEKIKNHLKLYKFNLTKFYGK